MNHISKEASDACMLMFVDEAAKNEHMVSWRYGCWGKGVCCMICPWYAVLDCFSHHTWWHHCIWYCEWSCRQWTFLKFIKELVILISIFFVMPLVTNTNWYKCYSQTLIPVLVVCLSWTTATSIMTSESVSWSKINIIGTPACIYMICTYIKVDIQYNHICKWSELLYICTCVKWLSTAHAELQMENMSLMWLCAFGWKPSGFLV